MPGTNANTWNPKTLVTFDAEDKTATEAFVAGAGQSTFTLLTFAYVLDSQALQVYKNGLLLTPNVDWIEATSISFSLIVAADAADKIVAVGYVAADAFPQTVVVDFTNAEIKDLVANPKILVAAPGAGKFVELVSCVLILNAGITVLTEVSPPDQLSLKYLGAAQIEIGQFDSTFFITSAVDAIITMYPAFFGTSANFVVATSLVNTAIKLANIGTDFAGNATNDATIRAIVRYVTHNSLGL